MTYSYTQISQYLACPRRYRYHYHYLDGRQEKDSRASLLFGRVFEKALVALFRREQGQLQVHHKELRSQLGDDAELSAT